MIGGQRREGLGDMPAKPFGAVVVIRMKLNGFSSCRRPRREDAGFPRMPAAEQLIEQLRRISAGSPSTASRQAFA